MASGGVFSAVNAHITFQRVVVLVLGSLSLILFFSVQFAIDDAASSTATHTIHIPVTGVPGGAANVSKTIVMGRTSEEDVSWLDELPDWQQAVYAVNFANATLKTPKNKGNEAMAYLSYVIDHYDVLPDVMVFLHPARKGYSAAWHNDGPGRDHVTSMQYLQLGTVLKKGYVNLRCKWEPGCPDEFYPLGGREHPLPPESQTTEAVYAEAWRHFFGESNPVPEVVGTTCCAQFAVSREAVRRRGRDEYRRMRDWLLQTELSDDISGRVFEYMWHVIFGNLGASNAVYCPERDICDCEVYGLIRAGCSKVHDETQHDPISSPE